LRSIFQIHSLRVHIYITFYFVLRLNKIFWGTTEKFWGRAPNPPLRYEPEETLAWTMDFSSMKFQTLHFFWKEIAKYWNSYVRYGQWRI